MFYTIAFDSELSESDSLESGLIEHQNDATSDKKENSLHTSNPALPHSLDCEQSNVQWMNQRLTTAFPSAEIYIQDTRGDDQHLSVVIKSAAFSQYSRVACHQQVYAALDQMRGGKIHAMSLKTMAS